MTSCLSYQDMAVFLDGSASPEQLTFWRRHLRVCDPCAVTVARLRAGLEPTAPEPEDGDDLAVDVGSSHFAIGLEPNLQLGDFRIERCFVIDLLGRRPYLYALRRR